MGLTLRQAAELCGKSRSTIHRALESGKLSGAKTDDGAWSIEPSELARVFPWDIKGHAQRDEEGHPTGQPAEAGHALWTKIEMLEEMLARERDTVDDLRKRLDRAEDRLIALTPPAPPAPPAAPARGLLGRLADAVRGK